MTVAVIPTSSERLLLTDRQKLVQFAHSPVARFFLLQAAQAPSARHTQTLQTYLIIHTVHICLLKKIYICMFFTGSDPLILKGPTPETCKDEGSASMPTEGVVSRYLNAACISFPVQ